MELQTTFLIKSDIQSAAQFIIHGAILHGFSLHCIRLWFMDKKSIIFIVRFGSKE